jgi:hypothetical protein
MKQSPRFTRIFSLLAAVSFVLIASSAMVAQDSAAADIFVGKYKGTVKATSGSFDLSAEIKLRDRKLLGSLITPQGEQIFASTELAGGKLKIKLGAPGSEEILTLAFREGKLVGDWKVGKETRVVELDRVLGGNPTPTADPLSGDWEAAADAQGQAIPFNLTLKLEGEKVTGKSSSHLGESTISSGSFKDGKFAIILESGGGQIALIATMVDGKLAGDFDYNGQLQGKWVATKKKP